MASDPDPRDTSEGRIGLLDVLIFLARHRRLLALLPLAAALGAAAITLLMPNMYAGITKILPPQQSQSSANFMLAQLGSIANLPTTSLGIKNPNDLYVGMLKSRTVADSLIARFGLMALYGRDTLQDARRDVEERTSISHGRDGIITIKFEDRDRKRAADVANAYVEELYKLTQLLAVTEAGHRRLFLERQLKVTREGLAEAELALKQTQETTGLIKLDEQGKAIIEAVASLRAQIAAKEVEAGAMRLFATERNPGYLRVQQEISGLRSELARLENTNRSRSGDIFVPTGKVPEAGLQYVRRLRDVRYYESVFELLAKQYEIAKIDEARDASVVQVLDPAVEPEKKSGPHRSRIVIVTALLALLAALSWAYLHDLHERLKESPEHSRKVGALRSLLRRR